MVQKGGMGNTCLFGDTGDIEAIQTILAQPPGGDTKNDFAGFFRRAAPAGG